MFEQYKMAIREHMQQHNLILVQQPAQSLDMQLEIIESACEEARRAAVDAMLGRPTTDLSQSTAPDSPPTSPAALLAAPAH